MDIGTLRGLGTVVIMVAFIGLVIWAYSGKRKKSFDEATMLPFADDPEAKSTSSKLLGVTKNDDLLESVHYSSPSASLLALTWLIFATRKGQRSSTTDETVGHPTTASRSTTTRCRSGGSCCSSAPWCSPWVPGPVPGPGHLERPDAGLPVRRRIRRQGKRLDRRPPVGKGNGQGRREVRPDLRQVRRDAHRGSRQGSAGGENGRSPVRLNCSICHGSDAKGAYGFPT